jgi:hypothetical protein
MRRGNLRAQEFQTVIGDKTFDQINPHAALHPFCFDNPDLGAIRPSSNSDDGERLCIGRAQRNPVNRFEDW